VPTFSESGLPNFTGGTWFALMAPSETPPAVVSELPEATRDVLSSAAFQKTLENQGVVIQSETGEVFRQYLSSEIEEWGELAHQIGLEPQ
jgi:tripartite-type tricarboxylate transporter receptor subunit TctC